MRAERYEIGVRFFLYRREMTNTINFYSQVSIYHQLHC